MVSGPLSSKWLRLLADPCAAELVNPPYTGSDAGYLIRTVDSFTPIITGVTGTAGNITTVDYAVWLQPYNYSTTTGYWDAGAAAGNSFASPAPHGFTTNFITTASGAVMRYRPVACCLRYVPSGPYSTRSGIAALGYSSGLPVAIGSPTLQPSVFSAAQRIVPVGSEQHEVRWLPTITDEKWTQTTAGNDLSAGCVFMALKNTDAIVLLGGVTAALNGSFEVTTVWEWVPYSAAAGVSIAPRAPSPYTTQSVLSTIRDMGAFLFSGEVGSAIRGAASHYGQQAITRALTGGVGSRVNRAPALLTAY
jgi:hypothetical protein